MSLDAHEQEQYQKTINTMQQARLLERVLILITVAVTIFANLFSMYSVARLSEVTDKNQRSAIDARKVNVERQQELKDYIKCVLLIRYDSPPEALTTREGAEKALDICAAKGNK